MDKAKKIILAVVVIVILAILGGLYYISTSDVELQSGAGASITLTKNFTLDEKSPQLASDGKVEIMSYGLMDNTQTVMDTFKAIKENGNASGYKNYSEDTINGFKVYEYAANPKDLKVLKYGSSTEWTEYPPINLTYPAGSKVDCDHYRVVTFVSPNNATMNQIVLIAKDANTDLYTPEINEMLRTIKVTEQ